MNKESEFNRPTAAGRDTDCCVAREPTVGELLDALIKETELNLERLRSFKSGLSLDYLGKVGSAFPVLRGQALR
jgi:hypothetical protein